jgi:uncharacterized Ntn-hydrolase superfamily protein
MTYSIVARDPAIDELGIAVQSRYFAAGREVLWIEAAEREGGDLRGK